MKYTNKTRSVFPHHDDSKTDLNVTNPYSVAILLCCPNQTNPFLHISTKSINVDLRTFRLPNRSAGNSFLLISSYTRCTFTPNTTAVSRTLYEKLFSSLNPFYPFTPSLLNMFLKSYLHQFCKN